MYLELRPRGIIFVLAARSTTWGSAVRALRKESDWTSVDGHQGKSEHCASGAHKSNDGSAVPCVVMYQGSESGCVLRDGCRGWRPPDSWAAYNWRRITKAAQFHNPSLCSLRSSGTSVRCTKGVAASLVTGVAAPAGFAGKTLRRLTCLLSRQQQTDEAAQCSAAVCQSSVWPGPW